MVRKHTQNNSTGLGGTGGGSGKLKYNKEDNTLRDVRKGAPQLYVAEGWTWRMDLD